MFPRQDPPASLLRAAAGQGGVVTTAQVLAHGLGRRPVERLLAAGSWHRVTKGLYYVEPGRPPWSANAWAGVLLGGDQARLGGLASGHLHGLEDAPPHLIEVLVPERSTLRSRERWRFIRERDGVRLRSIGDPPRTSIDDAVLDLCSGRDQARVIDLLTRAVQRRRTTPRMLRDRLAGRAGIGNRKFLELVLAEIDEGAESPLEIGYLRLERTHGLPRGRRQSRAGGTYRDVYYEEYQTVVELDGRLGHDGTARFRDMARDNRSTVSGAATLRFGYHDVFGSGCAVIAMVAGVLARRGWTRSLTRCTSCR